MNTQTWWLLTRATGIVAWLTLTATISWGVILSTKAFPARRRPAWLLDLHRWLGTLTIAFTAVHVFALLIDDYVDFGLADVTIPLWTSWRPGAVALGILAAWGLVAIQISSVLKRRLSRTVWRMIHFASYPVFLITTLHGVFAGSDSTRPLYRLVAVMSIGLVSWATIYRLVRPGKRPRRSAVGSGT